MKKEYQFPRVKVVKLDTQASVMNEISAQVDPIIDD